MVIYNYELGFLSIDLILVTVTIFTVWDDSNNF